MGSFDWLTTIVGIIYFGAVEGNPFLGGLAKTNLFAFTAIKLGTAFFVGFLFYQAEKILSGAENQDRNAARWVRLILRGAYVVSLVFLAYALLNNVWIIATIT